MSRREDLPSSLDIDALQQRLREFSAVRDWEQFHSPKNLVMALAGEIGELLEIFQWLTEVESADLSERDRMRATEEIADIQIYLLRLADVLGVSLPTAVADKITENGRKYPIELSKGSAAKHSELDTDR
jgi:dCTP diphosphatase